MADDWDMVDYSEVDLDGMDDPFKGRWMTLEKESKATSEYGNYNTYKLRTMIVKANDDLRQEVIAL